MFLLGDRQFPGALDVNPVGGVLAPVGSVFRFPLIWSSCALGTVRASRDGDEMLRIIEVDCVLLLSIGRPILSAAVVGVPQRHHVVNVEFAGIGDDDVAVRGQPFAGRHLAFPVGSVRDRGTALGDQHLVACILTISVDVGPVFLIVAVVVRQPVWYR